MMRFAGSSDFVASADSSLDADGPRPSVPDKAPFLEGVRRGLKKLGTTSLGRGRPPDVLRVDQLAGLAASLDAAWAPSTDRLDARPSPRQGRGLRTFDNLEKPLPQPPALPTADDSYDASQNATPKPSSDMSRAAPSGSRSSTMDSTTSLPPAQTYGGAQRSADVNGSQSTFAGPVRPADRENEGDPNMAPVSAGPSPAIGRPRSAGGPNHSATPPTSSHLSSLMCNVHRTTGREPHPLVGATTTILGDRLYVFGGRLLSRSHPVLTADLYELDLIHRHWTKIETRGDIPPPRYFHSMCALGDAKLVCYGGMSPANPSVAAQSPQAAPQNGQDSQPEAVVMSDIHIYDVSRRSWKFIPTADSPQGRYAHCATILPSTAIFSSVNAPMSAIQHNPSSGNPNQGTIGVNIDGTGGAEMVVVGGQDSANHYIEQISVFNLRSLKWTSTVPLGKSCGAYRSVVAPLPSSVTSRIGKSTPTRQENVASTTGISQEAKEPGCSMLIYSNYNFLDVKLELQVRSADGTLSEKPMAGSYTPPGLRFPNGGVIDTNFVVSGTYLTSSKQEYALWALDLKTLTWGRIDAGGSVFNQGSWNRGVLWNRRNTFVVLGNRKRSLVEDYNHRRLNFNHICMVELEAFGFYDNPRRVTPMSGYVSASSPYPPPTTAPSKLGPWTAGGRTPSKAAEELGNVALNLRELADMDILAVGGERIPVNSRILARRWGPYFVQLLREGAAATAPDGNDTATLRPSVFSHNPSRNSSMTITPFTGNSMGSPSRGMTLNDSNHETESLSPSFASSPTAVTTNSQDKRNIKNILSPPTPDTLSSSSRPRTLYLPHTYLTLQSLLYFLYTSTLPPPSSTLCTPQILCSLLQLARPYRIDGLLEAVVERLHGVLDSRNAAAVFNAAAMAAGGVGGWVLPNGEFLVDSGSVSAGSTGAGQADRDMISRTREALRINTAVGKYGAGTRARAGSGGEPDDSDGDGNGSAVSSTASSSAFDSESDAGSGAVSRDGEPRRRRDQGCGGEIWNGDVSAVIGLQKRGLRGLMEGRRLRERGGSITREGQSSATGSNARVGLGIA